MASSPRTQKVAVVFQGGGALGAFGAGAWSVIRRWLAAEHHELVALAGGSTGALNAALAAAAPGHDADVLEDCWREAIAGVSFPFLGWPWGRSCTAETLRRWNGFLTGTLFGNRGLYAAQPQNWLPWAEARRTFLPPYDPWPMRALLQRRGVRMRSEAGQPLLTISVTEVESGELKPLHSDEREIVPEHVLASAAIPGLFPPREIDGRLCWDGDLVRSSPIPGLGDRLIASGRVCRPPLRNDDISGEFDYSVERIEALITQGREAALASLPASPLALPRTPRTGVRAE